MSSAGISPYQQTSVYSEEQLLQAGFQPISIKSEQDGELCRKLVGIVESIKTFVWERFKLVGIDGQGKIPDFIIHLKDENAFYRPPSKSQEECFKFNDAYVSCPEVVCHEFTHGIVQYLNPLKYEGESGALDESIADVVGIVFKRSECAKDDWKIDGLRDLSKSFTVQDQKETKATYNDKGETNNDFGQVHHNSLLISHAFYLASTGLAKCNGDSGNKQLLGVWLNALKDLSDKEKNFKGFAAKTIEVSEKTTNNMFTSFVTDAWKKVGLL